MNPTCQSCHQTLPDHCRQCHAHRSTWGRTDRRSIYCSVQCSMKARNTTRRKK